MAASVKSLPAARVIALFFRQPGARLHFRELCRKARLSPPAAKAWCDAYVRLGWLRRERNANLVVYSLDNARPSVKAAKRAYIVSLLEEKNATGMVEGTPVSFCLYGSHASGEYDEKSDLDLLLIGRKEQINAGEVSRIERETGKRAQVLAMAPAEWERKKGKNDAFASSVLRNCVVLGGGQP